MLDNVNHVGGSDSYKAVSGTKRTVSVNGVKEESYMQEKASTVSVKQVVGEKDFDIEKQVKEAVDKVNKDPRFRRTGCEFTYHKKSKRVSIVLYDCETKEVIKEIPPEDTVKMLNKMHELAGLIMDEKK